MAICVYTSTCFFDLIFIDFSWLIIVKGILLMGILISEYYVMYRFFKPIALDEKQDFSSVQLFLNLFIFNALFMFVMLTNFHQVFVGKEFIIFGSLIGSLFFGSFMGGIYDLLKGTTKRIPEANESIYRYKERSTLMKNRIS